MSISFQERMARINAARPDITTDQRQPVPEPVLMTSADKTRVALINAALIGCIWMLPTGWLMGQPDQLRVVLTFLGTDSGDIDQSVNIGWHMGFASWLIFITYYRTVLSFWNAHKPTVTDWTLYISGLISGLIGYGPLTVLAHYTRDHAERFG